MGTGAPEFLASYRGDELDGPGERDRRIQQLIGRLSRLRGAVHRISERLDFGTFLQEVVDSSRTLMASRCGAIIVRPSIDPCAFQHSRPIMQPASLARL